MPVTITFRTRRETPPRGPTPYIHLFDCKRTPFMYLLSINGTSFTYRQEPSTLFLVNCCKRTIILIQRYQKPVNFFDYVSVTIFFC